MNSTGTEKNHNNIKISILNKDTGKPIFTHWAVDNTMKITVTRALRQHVNLTNADLSNQDLSGITFNAISLSGVTFENSCLSKARFIETCLSDINFPLLVL